jgi:hypothetical protein
MVKLVVGAEEVRAAEGRILIVLVLIIEAAIL